MTEEVEYKLSGVKCGLDMVIGVGLLAVSLLVLLVGMLSESGLVTAGFAFLSVVYALTAVLWILRAVGKIRDGHIRGLMQKRVLGRQIVDYHDPPLADWYDEIEEKGGFRHE